MSERGRRGWVRWGIAILAGWLIATGAQAQQTAGVDDSQGGFVVIEDASTPPPPPKPLHLSATTEPLVGAAGSASPYKPGSAVYEIPWAKHGPTSPSATPVAPHSAAANVTVPVTKTTAALPSRDASVATRKPVTPPPPPAPSWSWTIKQGYSIEQQLQEMAKKAHWNVVWHYKDDILAGSDKTLHDDFPTSAETIIKILAANGALIHYTTFDGNNTFLVCGPQPCPSTTLASPELEHDHQGGLQHPAADGDGQTGASTP